MEVDARKKRYWQYLRDSYDSSHSGVVISPDGWRDAVEWLLTYTEDLEHELAGAHVHKETLTARLRGYRGFEG